MLPGDRAQLNAHLTLQLLGVWAKPRCVESELGWVCVAPLAGGYVVLRCSGAHAEVCTGQVVRRKA